MITNDGIPAEPHCPRCGTVLQASEGGYDCRNCEAWFYDLEVPLADQ